LWKQLWRGWASQRLKGYSPKGLNFVSLNMPGWSEDASSDGDLRVWHDHQGNVLSLAAPKSLGLPNISNKTALQGYARELAESRHAGLIEVRAFTGTLGAAVGLAYKRLQKPAYVFTGMLLAPRQDHTQVWTVVAAERGITGEREAVITAELMKTIHDYERSWAQDPYNPSYCRIDRSVLRFMSDDERYDVRFPEHPLSNVRRVLAALPLCVVESGR
jgi:hypothetical protein